MPASTHMQFVDKDGDVHVVPRGKIYLSSDIEESELTALVELGCGGDVSQFEVSKEEFERLAKELTKETP